MVCRTTPGGRVTTPHLRMTLGWDDAQCTSLYHRLRRHASERQIATSEEEYRNEIRRIRLDVLSMPNIGSAAQRRALARIEDALAAPAPDPEDMWATCRMRSEAAVAEARISYEILSAAQQASLPGEFVRSEYHRLRVDAPDGARNLSDVTFPIPNDVGTRYAIHTLRAGYRCGSCGQFINPPFASSHSCPYPDAGAEDAENTTTLGASTTSGTLDVVSIDEFQEFYDAAQERIRAGDTAVPNYLDWETAPGQVTGGLSGPGGTTFGLEIEIDFPDDEYPYEARQILAERLYMEGIAMSPNVMRWHFLGGEGEDRPGGEYVEASDGWSCEFDRTVDNVDGERGVEIKSQILTDVPETWANLRRICEIARELGGRPTRRTGVHVNIGADDFPDDDPLVHMRLLRLLESMDDTLIRLAHNPESGTRHRGRDYCAPVHVPQRDLQDVTEVKRFAGHYHAVNLGHLPDEYSERTSSSRIEMRIFDSSLDIGRLQAQVTLSLALAKAAAAGDEAGFGRQTAGYARQTFGGRRLSGERWEEASAPFRRLLAIMKKHGAGTPRHLSQFTHLFAESRWPHS